MTDQRTFVTFDASFADDAEFSSSGDIVVPGGRNVCREIADLLIEQGFEVSKPAQHDYYGWEITAKKDGHSVRFLLQDTGRWLLLAENGNGVFGLLDRSGDRLRETLNALSNAMIEDGRFKGLLWFTRAEYESAKTLGSPSP